MPKRYAMIKDERVVNVILWDGETPWFPGPEWFVLDCPDEVGPGWTYRNTDFFPPEPAE